MARRKRFVQIAIQTQRELERQRQAQIHAHTQAQREAERARKAYEKARLTNERERKRLYTEQRATEVDLLNEELARQIKALESILHATLPVDDYFDLDKLKEQPVLPSFKPGNLTKREPAPDPADFAPPKPGGLRRFLLGAKEQYQRALAEATTRYEETVRAHAAREAERQRQMDEARRRYEQQLVTLQLKTVEQHAEVEQFKKDLAVGQPEAAVNYFALVLEASAYPEGFPRQAKLAYIRESKQLIVEYELPPFEVVPEVASYRYLKAKDAITTTARPVSQRRALYVSVIAQVTLRTLHELFEADRFGLLETIVFNGYVATLDRGTGWAIRPYLVTVRTMRDTFERLNLHHIEPEACLKTLNASLSKSPTEMVPVRPVLELNTVDPRFVEEADMLSILDQRPNLMELSPKEFESLITNLFQKMGLETHLTQASRDGGVDCMAFDPRPIFGGKVVIQAKRYKNTVGVSAVRDLFGTVQNEGASKGILVTTSGYGKAAFEFAAGKPLELLSGSHLLYLLAKHAGIEAKIAIPEYWKDPALDSAP